MVIKLKKSYCQSTICFYYCDKSCSVSVCMENINKTICDSVFKHVNNHGSKMSEGLEEMPP